VVGAKDRTADHDECEKVKSALRPLGIGSSADRQQQGKGDSKIIGPALQQAEVTGIIAGELKNPRASDGCGGNGKNGERGFLRIQFF